MSQIPRWKYVLAVIVALAGLSGGQPASAQGFVPWTWNGLFGPGPLWGPGWGWGAPYYGSTYSYGYNGVYSAGYSAPITSYYGSVISAGYNDCGCGVANACGCAACGCATCGYNCNNCAGCASCVGSGNVISQPDGDVTPNPAPPKTFENQNVAPADEFVPAGRGGNAPPANPNLPPNNNEQFYEPLPRNQDGGDVLPGGGAAPGANAAPLQYDSDVIATVKLDAVRTSLRPARLEQPAVARQAIEPTPLPSPTAVVRLVSK